MKVLLFGWKAGGGMVDLQHRERALRRLGTDPILADAKTDRIEVRPDLIITSDYRRLVENPGLFTSQPILCIMGGYEDHARMILKVMGNSNQS